MPRPPKLDPIRSTIRDLGAHIGRELAAAIAVNAGASSNVVKRGRPRGGGAACAVPGCTRPKAAKGLCNNHYGKARKMRMNLDGLSAAQLSELGQDGRAVRWQRA
jgi:hypothetical protein